MHERRRRLVQQVRDGGSAHIDDLAAALGVSAATVRRDLDALDSEGLLVRARGGAYLPQPDDLSPARPAHPGEAHAKQRIGAHAAERVENGMTVMILGGSTTAAMLPHLADRSVSVVTNGLEIAHALSAYPSVDVVILGGVLHREQMTFLGPMTEQSMANLHVDIMFAGAFGVDPRAGVTGAKISQAGNHHMMLQHTESLVILADATKFGRQGPTLLARVDQVDTFVTDDNAPTAKLDELLALGARITVC